MYHIEPAFLIPAIETQAVSRYHTAKRDAAELPPAHQRQRARIELDQDPGSPCRRVNPLPARMNRNLRACVRQARGADDATALTRDGDDKQPVEIRRHVQRSSIGRDHGSERVSLHRYCADAELSHEVDDSNVLGELVRDPGPLPRWREHDTRGRDTDWDEPQGRKRFKPQVLEHGCVPASEPRGPVARDRNIEWIARHR